MFFFPDGDDDEGEEKFLQLNWNALLRELETREKLESVEFCSSPTRTSRPFFRALQRNSNVRSLTLAGVDFTIVNVDDVVAFLDAAPNLMNLSFWQCNADSDDVALKIAASLGRNTRIECLSCEGHLGIEISLLQSMTSADYSTGLKTLDYTHYDSFYRDEEPN